jgi:ribonuclease P/MRP protein subunit RPP1
VTITIEDPATLNSNIISAAKQFDIIAARPLTEKALQWLGGNNNPDIDILSLDISQRLPFPLRHGLFTNLVSRGVAIEICYAAGMGDTAARRNIISNATGLIRATRGRGLLISSEARRAADLRGPFDVINLATFWGMKQEFGMGDGKKVLLHSEGRQLTYKGAVQIITQEVRDLEKAELERPKQKVVEVEIDKAQTNDKPRKRRRTNQRRSKV